MLWEKINSLIVFFFWVSKMSKVIIKVNRNSEISMNFAKRVAEKLSRQDKVVSIESQQLIAAGLMNNPNYEVVDVNKLTISNAIRLIKEASAEIKKSAYVIVHDDEFETVQQRIDRETLTEELKETGATVFETEDDLVNDISDRYSSLGLEINKGEMHV